LRVSYNLLVNDLFKGYGNGCLFVPVQKLFKNDLAQHRSQNSRGKSFMEKIKQLIQQRKRANGHLLKYDSKVFKIIQENVSNRLADARRLWVAGTGLTGG